MPFCCCCCCYKCHFQRLILNSVYKPTTAEVVMSENNLNDVCNMTTAPTQDPTIAIHNSKPLRDSVSICNILVEF